MKPEAKAFRLDADRDGVLQITEILLCARETDTLHVISHGSPGCLYLGNSQLSLDSLGHYAVQLQGWQLDNLLLYGCNVAAGDGGAEFIAKLHRLTGAQIAASKSPTGAAALGGDWELKQKTARGASRSFDAKGEAESRAPVTLALSAEAMMAYQGILAPLNANDYAALQALYNSTSGDNWTNKEGWNVSGTTPPEAAVVNNWYGVTVEGAMSSSLTWSNTEP